MIKCHNRYLQLTDDGFSCEARWTAAEDKVLTKAIMDYPDQANIKWQDIADKMPGRLARQCRERWLYQANPNVVKDKWTDAEDLQLVKLYQQFGSQWKRMSETI